jgi:prevent-host-death family protein
VACSIIPIAAANRPVESFVSFIPQTKAQARLTVFDSIETFYKFDIGEERLQVYATMKIATVRDLRNRYMSVLRWVSAGEDVLITQRGKVIARLSPENDQTAQEVDWASSPEVLRDRSGDSVLSAEQSAEILSEAGGRW